MRNSLLADLVLLLHALFIVWVAAGALAVCWRPWLAALHLPALAWGLFVECTGGACPLTPLEQRLRAAAGEGGWGGSFVEHYLGAIVYPAGLTREAQVLLGAALAALNLGLYAWAWHRLRSRLHKEPAR